MVWLGGVVAESWDTVLGDTEERIGREQMFSTSILIGRYGGENWQGANVLYVNIDH